MADGWRAYSKVLQGNLFAPVDDPLTRAKPDLGGVLRALDELDAIIEDGAALSRSSSQSPRRAQRSLTPPWRNSPPPFSPSRSREGDWQRVVLNLLAHAARYALAVGIRCTVVIETALLRWH